MSKKSFVGLDIGGSGIRAAEVKGKPGAHKIVRAASVDLPPGVIVDGQIVDQSALVSALKKLWKSGKFSSKKVAFAVIDNGIMFGGYQAIARDPETGVLTGATEMRKDGQASGY